MLWCGKPVCALRTILHRLGHLVCDVVEEVSVLNENVLRLLIQVVSMKANIKLMKSCWGMIGSHRKARTWNMAFTAWFWAGLAKTIAEICEVRSRRMPAQAGPAAVATVQVEGKYEI